MEVDISKLAMTSDYGLRLFMSDLKTRSFGEDTWDITVGDIWDTTDVLMEIRNTAKN